MKVNNLIEILRSKAQAVPDRPFIIYGQKQVTFKELDEYSSYLSRFLADSGVEKGDRVAIWMYNCPEFIISYFAILKLGAVVVPVNNMFKRQEAKFVIDDSGSVVLLCSPEKIEDSCNINLRVSILKKIISFSFDTQVDNEVIDLYSLIRRKKRFFGEPDISSSHIAEILYTSGTTGRPKGACLTHGNLISNVEDCIEVIKANSRDRFICLLPLFHSFASTVCMLFPLYLGAATVVFRVIRPFKRVIRSIRKNKVTVFVGVPSLFNVLKDIKIPAILQNPLMKLLNPVRVCISGAAALPPKLIPVFEKKFRVKLLEGYGLTEAAPVVSLNLLKGKRKLGSIGLPLPSVRVKIIDDRLEESRPGQIGELLVKGPNVMKGYWNTETETKSILEDGWLHTGDLAKADREGFIYIVGRAKDMINVRGLNVYPREVEEVLYQLDFVKEAAVVGIDHPRKGEVPVGFVVLKKTGQVSAKQIHRFLRDNVAAFKVPFKIELRESLPKNAAGKIQKFILKEEIEKELFNRLQTTGPSP